MYPAYTMKLGLHAKKTDVNMQKINKFHLNTFKIVIADYSVKNKLKRVRFFQKTFLLANISLERALKMLFFTFNKADIQFAE